MGSITRRWPLSSCAIYFTIQFSLKVFGNLITKLVCYTWLSPNSVWHPSGPSLQVNPFPQKSSCKVNIMRPLPPKFDTFLTFTYKITQIIPNQNDVFIKCLYLLKLFIKKTMTHKPRNHNIIVC